jgi:hypothetical protein
MQRGIHSYFDADFVLKKIGYYKLSLFQRFKIGLVQTRWGT